MSLDSGDGHRPSIEPKQAPNHLIHPPTDQPLPPRHLSARLQEYRAAGWQLAPQYEERLRKSDDLKKELRMNGRDVGIRYAGEFAPLNWEDEYGDPHIDILKLRNLEVVVKNQIQDVLGMKRRRNGHSPVVIMDFGGMYGESILRLAHHFKDLVLSGDVAFVITNLVSKPHLDTEQNGWRPRDFTEEDVKLINDNRHLVHYIITDADELKSQSISIPHHGELPLYGNIDVIQEHLVLTHSSLPDTDLPTLASALSPSGMLFLASQSVSQIYKETEEELAVRQQAFRAGLVNMARTGATRLPRSGSESYAIYVKPEAPTKAVAQHV